jgi:phage gp36-like protein
MRYATREQLEKVWGAAFVAGLLPADIIADEADDGEAPEGAIAEAIDGALDLASDEIDLHLSARYTLPLAAPPAVLVTPCANIAVYILANRHTALTETIEDRYEQATKLLERIADGKAGLGADEPSVAGPDASAGGAAFSADERQFRGDW